jgi:pimeloyl-ACP methyl ester carboxylesterase
MSLKLPFLIPLFLFTCIFGESVEIKKANVNGIEIAYYTRGKGEPLVLVMGFRGTMAIWDPALINALAENYEVILFDNRGAGLSTDTEENHTTIEQMASDTIGLVRSLGYNKVHLLGWSMGSMIAMQVAIDYPDALNSLILCSPNPGGKHQVFRKRETSKKLTSQELSKEEGLKLLFPADKRGQLAAHAFEERVEIAILEGNSPDNLKVASQTVERQINAIHLRTKDNSFFERLSSIKIPTLVAGGLADILDLPENARTVACQIPFAWSAYFPDAGHAFLFQDYLNFSQLIKNFIRSTHQ